MVAYLYTKYMYSVDGCLLGVVTHVEMGGNNLHKDRMYVLNNFHEIFSYLK